MKISLRKMSLALGLFLLIGGVGINEYLYSASMAFAQTRIYNVKDYGAKGNGDPQVNYQNGVHDTASIQAAIDAAQQTGGGTVFFPKGVYKIGILQVGNNIILEGEAGSKLYYPPTTETLDYNIMRVGKNYNDKNYAEHQRLRTIEQKNGLDYANNIIIRNLELYSKYSYGYAFKDVGGRSSDSRYIYGIRGSFSNLLIENCSFHNLGYGGININRYSVINLENHNEFLVVRDCRIYDNPHMGIQLVSSRHFWAENNYIDRCGYAFHMEPEIYPRDRMEDINVMRNRISNSRLDLINHNENTMKTIHADPKYNLAAYYFSYIRSMAIEENVLIGSMINSGIDAYGKVDIKNNIIFENAQRGIVLYFSGIPIYEEDGITLFEVGGRVEGNYCFNNSQKTSGMYGAGIICYRNKQYGANYDLKNNFCFDSQQEPTQDYGVYYNSCKEAEEADDNLAEELGGVKTVELSFSPGVNYFSLPVNPGYFEVEKILSYIEGDYKTVVEEVAAYAPKAEGADAGGWLRYQVGAASDAATLHKIVPGAGYKIIIKNTAGAAVKMKLRGIPIYKKAVQLYKGLNLVGINTLTKIGDLEAMRPIAREFVWLTYGSASVNELEPGKAYFINVNKDCLWDIAWKDAQAKLSVGQIPEVALDYNGRAEIALDSYVYNPRSPGGKIAWNTVAREGKVGQGQMARYWNALLGDAPSIIDVSFAVNDKGQQTAMFSVNQQAWKAEDWQRYKYDYVRVRVKLEALNSDNEKESGFVWIKVLNRLDATRPVISGVVAQNISSGRADIVWTTNEPAASRVDYGVTPLYGKAAVDEQSFITTHRIKLAGLQPKTTYHYRVRSKDSGGNEALSQDYVFKTSANHNPVVYRIYVSPNPVDENKQAVVTVTASDADGDNLRYTWKVINGGGSITGSASQVKFMPPDVNAVTVCTLLVKVSDINGGYAIGVADIMVQPVFN
jgi:hypothetical protein